MYTLLRNGFTRDGLTSQIPSLGVTIVVAELFYKFHSFSLEFLAALATWLAIDFVLVMLLSVARAIRDADRMSEETE